MNTDERTQVKQVKKLETLRQRFQRWRQTCKPRSRIPAKLWSAAATLAEVHGVSRVATTLGLDYYSLKKQLARRTVAAVDAPATSPAPPFWELAPVAVISAAPPAHTGECTLELADAAGNTLRLQLRGAATPDLAALSRSFWNSAP